jgi:hypothetical protein
MSEKTEEAVKAAEHGTSVKVSQRLDELEGRLDVVESVLRLELGVDVAEHAAALERAPGGVAGDAGHVG